MESDGVLLHTKSIKGFFFSRSVCNLSFINAEYHLSASFRNHAFQLIAVDGVCSGVIQFPTAEDCLDWLQALASNISSLTQHNVSVKEIINNGNARPLALNQQ